MQQLQEKAKQMGKGEMDEQSKGEIAQVQEELLKAMEEKACLDEQLSAAVKEQDLLGKRRAKELAAREAFQEESAAVVKATAENSATEQLEQQAIAGIPER